MILRDPKFSIAWYGTASLQIKTNQGMVWIDPFVPLKGSPVHISKETFLTGKVILLTHGHMDHICSVPWIEDNKRMQIFCSKTPAKNLEKMGVDRKLITEIKPGDNFPVQGLQVQVLHGRHIKFDKPLVKKTLWNKRMIQYADNLPYIMYHHLNCPENGEIVGYQVTYQKKTIVILGSLGLMYGIDYPSRIDLLVLPYQGNSDLLHPALQIIKTIQPKAILLDHFDDTFPPISDTVDTEEFVHVLRHFYPTIPVHRLQYGEEYDIL